jgi:competence CoiA-like predicted nuclease
MDKHKVLTRAVSSIKISDRRHTDCFRFFARETQLKHELAKFSLYIELRLQGHTVYVEPTFYNLKGRPDILDITTQTIWEVTNTEKKENVELKKGYYPDCFEVISISSDKLLKQLSAIVEKAKGN